MNSLLSSSWYRVSALKPRLRASIEVHRRSTGNEVEFILQDHSLGKFYRFNVNAYDILGRMNGNRSVNEMWEATVACLGDEAPTQDDIIALLGRLHAVDALQLNVTPDCLELFQRAQRSKKTWWKTVLRTPLSVRLPLHDPERALNVLMPIIGPLFSRIGMAGWVLIVVWAVVVAGMHWPELTHGGLDQILVKSNLVLMLVLYPLVKVFHEFGHAITTRKWGGEVHEMGITLLFFVPVPYVDASSMTAIESKYRRMVVGASGIMVELFLAAIALLVWINVEPGLIRAVAFNVMLISGVSTLIFNGNPLLRFDAYYIFKDAMEIPNLASRSSRYLYFLAQRYLFGMNNIEAPATRKGEVRWLVGYGIAAGVFRVLMSVTIVLLIAGHYFLIGIVLAIWASVLLIIAPLVKLAHFVFCDQALTQNRVRAVSVSLAIVTTLCGFIFFAPVPSATQAQGVLWLPEQAQVQAGTNGVITELLAEPFDPVQVGQPLLAMADPLLESRIKVLEAELGELRVRHRIEDLKDQVQAALIKDQMTSKQAEFDRERERAKNLVILSSTDGSLVLQNASDLPGRYLQQGDQIGFVLDRGAMMVRVAVPQDRIGLVRESLRGVEVKLAESIQTSIPAKLARGVPAAQQKLPSKVLGTEGGGSIAVDPGDEEGLTPLQSVFVVDVTLQDDPSAWHIGQRAYVKFDHGKQTLAKQWYRLGRQMFIRRFGA